MQNWAGARRLDRCPAVDLDRLLRHTNRHSEQPIAKPAAARTATLPTDIEAVELIGRFKPVQNVEPSRVRAAGAD